MAGAAGRVETPSPSNYNDANDSKLWRKVKQAPFVPIGIAGFVGAIAYGAYGYKNRRGMSTSVYLMHLRVKAQSMVVGAMTIGVAIQMCRTLYDRHNAKADGS